LHVDPKRIIFVKTGEKYYLFHEVTIESRWSYW